MAWLSCSNFFFVLSSYINGVIKFLHVLLIFGMFKALMKLANTACQTLLFVSVSLVKDDNGMAILQQFLFVLSRINGVIKFLHVC